MKKQKTSLFSRSSSFMRDQGFLCQKVEVINKLKGSIWKKDLFGFIDMLCIKENCIIGVQVTSVNEIMQHTKKIFESENYNVVKSSGIIIVMHAWKQINNKWEVIELLM